MKIAMLAWLADAGAWAWQVSLPLFLVLNAAAVGALLLVRDRGLVNRWTSRWLAANLALLGLGLGVPVLAGLLRFALSAMPSLGSVAATRGK